MSRALEPSASAREIARAVRAGEATALAVTQAALKRAEQAEAKLHAFLQLLPGLALARARDLDRLKPAQKDRLPLLGVPFAVKDNYCVLATRTTCGSKILENFVAPYTATAVKRLEEAGAVLIAKTNMDEFAMGSSTEHSAFGPVRNPWDPARVPGGSSGGSAAAVASGVVPLALGSDTGGSVKQPAALCGIYGLRPSYGAVSRHGLIAFASSLDTVAPFARSAPDLDLALAAMAGPDGMDLTAIPPAPPAGEVSLKGLKFGRLDAVQADPAVREALARQCAALTRAGATVEAVEIPSAAAALQIYYLIAPAECSSNLARFDGVRFGPRGEAADLEGMYVATRERGFGPEVKRRILLGTFALSAGYQDQYFVKAQKARGRLAGEFAAAFKRVDFLIGPATPGPAFKLGEKTADPVAMYLNDVYTIPSCLAGLPGLAIPAGFTELDGAKLPIGLQLIAPAGGDRRLLALAAALANGADAPVAPRC